MGRRLASIGSDDKYDMRLRTVGELTHCQQNSALDLGYTCAVAPRGFYSITASQRGDEIGRRKPRLRTRGIPSQKCSQREEKNSIPAPTLDGTPYENEDFISSQQCDFFTRGSIRPWSWSGPLNS